MSYALTLQQERDKVLRLRRARFWRVPNWSDDHNKPTGWIYFIQGGKYVKIGYTAKQDIRKRMAELQTGCPFPLKLLAAAPGNLAFERYLHAEFSDYRTSGEWFRLAAPGMRQIIAQAKESLFI